MRKTQTMQLQPGQTVLMRSNHPDLRLFKVVAVNPDGSVKAQSERVWSDYSQQWETYMRGRVVKFLPRQLERVWTATDDRHLDRIHAAVAAKRAAEDELRDRICAALPDGLIPAWVRYRDSGRITLANLAAIVEAAQEGHQPPTSSNASLGADS